MIEKNHIEPKAINDSFSATLFIAYINALDPDRLYFTKPDITQMEQYQLTLDDDFATSQWAFFNTSVTSYLQQLKRTKTIIEEVSSRPFDFTRNDVFNTALDTVWATNEKQLKDKWQQHLKWEVLELLENVAVNQLKKKGAINKTEVLKKEAELRGNIRAKYLDDMKELLASEQTLHKELATLYLNTFLQCLDPHSSYFDGAAKEDFKRGLNTEGYYFGLSLAENDKGEVTIDHLVPGGSAWMSGDLNKEDVIVQLKWADKEPMDVTGLSAMEVSTLLDASNTEKLEMTVRKTNGQTATVTLQKTVLQNDDNIVKSFLLKGEGNIGYINLPSFYTEWEESSGSKCASDVAREIIKLKKDGIGGLILDLRFNGGGSLSEAIEMAGIFIDEGGICQMKTKEPKPVVLKDINRGVIYSGPLLILVNGQSASASELLAAALQDYNRALIVGSQTYGKATGQQVLPVEYATSVVLDKEKSYVKLTTSRLYRITGKSLQKQGVHPDIMLPDIYENIPYRELSQPFALAADTIAAYKYFKPQAPISLSVLKKNSAIRVVNNPKFKALVGIAATLASATAEKISMKWEDAEKRIKTEYQNLNSTNTTFSPTKLYSVFNNSNDQNLLAKKIIPEEINQHWLNKLAKDIYIEESYQILSDFIKIKQ